MTQTSFAATRDIVCEKALVHYVKLVCDTAMTYFAPGLVGRGMFVSGHVRPGCVVAEHCGTRVTHAEAVRLTTAHELAGVNDE